MWCFQVLTDDLDELRRAFRESQDSICKLRESEKAALQCQLYQQQVKDKTREISVLKKALQDRDVDVNVWIYFNCSHVVVVCTSQ